jgi:hypothetical protein
VALPIIIDTRAQLGEDTTAVGKNPAPPAVRATLGNYPVLGESAAARMPEA